MLEKWSSEKWSPKNGSRKKWSSEKWSPENWSPGNSETKNRGVSVEHRGVCVECWHVINLWKPKTRQNPKLGSKPETRKQKIVGWVSSIVVCVWNVRMWSIYENPKLDNKHKTRKQSQNRKQTSWGERWTSWCVCTECSDVINLWKPKTRQQIFLDSFSVPQFGTYVGSWRERQTFFVCVVESIDKNGKVV